MKCQNCGADVPEEKIYCEKCGTAIQMVPDYNPVEDIPIGTGEPGGRKAEAGMPENQEAGTGSGMPEKKPPVWHRRRYQLAFAGILVLGFLVYRISYRLIVKPQETIEEEHLVTLLPEPEFSMAPGIYNYTLQLNISHAEKEQGTIYYTTDGTMPGVGSRIYRQPISLSEGQTKIRAIFIRKDGLESELAEGTYEVVFDYPEDPVFSVEAGDYAKPFTVRITAEPDCRIYYTTNGEEPDLQSSVYRGAISVPAGLTVLQAIAVDEEGGVSGIAEAIYNVQEGGEPPVQEQPSESAGIP